MADQERSFLLGNIPGADVSLETGTGPLALRLTRRHGAWTLAVKQGAVAVRVDGRPVTSDSGRVPVGGESIIEVGDRSIALKRILDAVSGNRGNTRGHKLLIGRAPECDVVLDSPVVSRYHALVQVGNRRATIKDLHSTNGVFVNGQAIATCALCRDDLITIGPYTLVLTGEKPPGLQVLNHSATLAAHGIGYCVGGRNILSNISFAVRPGEIMAVMGESGSGKSTLLELVSGAKAPGSGMVTINGWPLAVQRAACSGLVGYMPQYTILYDALTVYETMDFYCRFKLPGLPREVQAAIIKGILTELDIWDIRRQHLQLGRRSAISDGERRRLKLAVELISEPGVLILDEPLSGLSAKDALLVMRKIGSLAKQGKTILMVLHQPDKRIFQCTDLTLLLHKGNAVYFGPSYPDAILYFNPQSLAETDIRPEKIFSGMDRQGARNWEAAYQQSDYYRLFTLQRLQAVRKRSSPAHGTASSAVVQGLNLFTRGVRLKLRDRMGSIILLLQSPIIALLLLAVFLQQSSRTTELFIMAVAAVWFGLSNSAREIVAEQNVFRKERMSFLQVVPYFCHKFIMMQTLAVLQVVVLLLMTYRPLGFTGPPLDMMVTLLLLSAVGIALGLLVSTVAKTPESAIFIVPIIMLPVIVLAGLIVPYRDLGRIPQVLASISPSKWGFEALLNLESPAGPPAEGPGAPVPLRSPVKTIFGADHFGLIQDWAVLLVYAGVVVLLAVHVLRKKSTR